MGMLDLTKWRRIRRADTGNSGEDLETLKGAQL